MADTPLAGALNWVSVVIPALNEEATIGNVVREIPRDVANEIIVVDNGSIDHTARYAVAAGARVVDQSQRGYGRACLAGFQSVDPRCTIVVFLDGDGSDCPEYVNEFVRPIVSGSQDFVIGSRTRGKRERGSMNSGQIAAGRVMGLAVRALYGVAFTDMCPFRAISREALARLGMTEPTYGWNLEMQMRAARARLRILEIPVPHRRRAGGQSKVSGTFHGTLIAGTRILSTFVRVALC
jgi:glycosyltransferase involved in cell wall biosynthesis